MSEYLVTALVGANWTIVGRFQAETGEDAIRAAALEQEQSQRYRAYDTATAIERTVAYRRRVVGLSEPDTPGADSADPSPAQPPSGKPT